MNTIKDSGPAFPTMDDKRATVSDGMSLRDYFAAKAMQGILAGVHPICKDIDPLSSISSAAYKIADAMLSAREDS